MYKMTFGTALQNYHTVQDFHIPVIHRQKHCVFATVGCNISGLYVLFFLDGAEIIQHVHHAEAWWLPLCCAPEEQIPVVFLVALKERGKSS